MGSSDIVITLDRMPVERFQLANTPRRQFLYVDLNRELGDRFGLLNIQFDPRSVMVTKLTVLTNDERPWDVRPPLPPVPQTRVVTVTSEGKASTEDGHTTEACQKAISRGSDLVTKTCADQKGLFLGVTSQPELRDCPRNNCKKQRDSRGHEAKDDYDCTVTIVGNCEIKN